MDGHRQTKGELSKKIQFLTSLSWSFESQRSRSTEMGDILLLATYILMFSWYCLVSEGWLYRGWKRQEHSKRERGQGQSTGACQGSKADSLEVSRFKEVMSLKLQVWSNIQATSLLWFAPSCLFHSFFSPSLDSLPLPFSAPPRPKQGWAKKFLSKEPALK